MDKPKKTRWLQRFDNFDQFFPQLTQACEIAEYDDLGHAGLIKTFELCFDLSWKVLKDLLSYEGYDVTVPREVIRKSFEAHYINEGDCEILLEALDKRNVLSHVYRADIALEVEALIKKYYYPTLLRLHATLNEKSKQQSKQ
ncbi:MAG: nucleotidyltransferase substrate binding protein [Chromatiales bacterium]|nr:nucleotidyltransferase substrate binding protein [Chromatiales bacterium]